MKTNNFKTAIVALIAATTGIQAVNAQQSVADNRRERILQVLDFFCSQVTGNTHLSHKVILQLAEFNSKGITRQRIRKRQPPATKTVSRGLSHKQH